MPPAGTPAAMLALDLDLIHHCLGHACEAICHTHVQHSELRRRHTSTAAISPDCAESVHLVNRLPCLIKRHQLCLGSMQRAPLTFSWWKFHWCTTCSGHVTACSDVSTHYHWTTPLRLKGEAMDMLHHIILSMPETHHPLTLHTDGGGKFFNACLDLWLNKQGILHPPAPPYTSEYSSPSEHFLCT